MITPKIEQFMRSQSDGHGGQNTENTGNTQTQHPISGREELLKAVIASDKPLSPDDQTALTLIYSPEELTKGTTEK